MKINIAASHRFHLLDLARELSDEGHDVRFYSYLPTKRMKNFGLRLDCINSLLWLVFPILILEKILRKNDDLLKVKNHILDSYLSLFMRKCDVYIALGTVYVKSLEVSKRKGAITILEWGSTHILEQQEVLKKVESYKPTSEYFVNRALNGFKIADYIAVASQHVKEGFVRRGVKEGRIFANPYGVDLSMFSPTKLETNKDYDIIFVGGWSYRKGSDLLTQVCIENNYTLLHVGAINDLQFPNHDNMTHVDAVNQKELIHYYKKARIFVMPSREDGFGMVLSQAVICGLPIVCSQNTGGSTIKSFLEQDMKEYIQIMENYNESSLMYCIKKALLLAKNQEGKRSYSKSVPTKLSWKQYGKRYNDILKQIASISKK